MGVPFDHIAISDSVATNTAAGQLQRKLVWNYLASVMTQLRGQEILELNQGTAEDSDLFAEHGRSIVATDVSAEMLKVAVADTDRFSMSNRISTRFVDLDSLDITLFDKKFDLVFSNLDTISNTNPDSLKLLFKKLPHILKPGGRFIGVVMPKFCMWESLFFISDFKFRKAFSRMFARTRKHDNENDRHWFYSPAEVKQWSKEKFKTLRIIPVGIALPPMHTNHVFTLSKTLLIQLGKLEKLVASLSTLAYFSDHFIVDLQLE